MATKRTPARTVATAPADPVSPIGSASAGVPADQALALIGMGLVQRLAAGEDGGTWIWNEAEDGGKADLAGLRRRLELTALALQTGAPLSTAEVTFLMGARPGTARVERGGLVARRLSRNVWKLDRSSGSSGDEEGRSGFASSGFNSGFGRRF